MLKTLRRRAWGIAVTLIITLIGMAAFYVDHLVDQQTVVEPDSSPIPVSTRLSIHSELTGELVCDYYGEGKGEGSHLFLTDLDASMVTQLTEEDDGTAKWSPDGRQIAFVSWRDGNGNIYLMNSDGGSLQRLTDYTGYDAQINWSPGGERLAFVSDRDGNTEIYTLDVVTRAVKRLTYNNRADGDPAWSSDGKKIAYASGGDLSYDIYIMDADGGNAQQLPITTRYGSSARPFWCSDDSCLIYEETVYNNRQYSLEKHQKLFLYDFASGESRRLLSDFPMNVDHADEWYGSLSKGRQYILFWLVDNEQDLMYAYDMETDRFYSLGALGGPCDLYP